MSSPEISVCMAAYNGARYIGEQLRSILDQLGPDDEVVVVDDASKDATADVVEAVGDPRVRLLRAPANRGYVRTFEAAIQAARGRFVFLADQDDVWRAGRVTAMRAALEDRAVVATNLATLGRGGTLTGPFGQPDWHLRAADSDRPWRNVLGILAGNRPYYGCAMAVRRDALTVALPFPAYLNESHDLWLALVGNLSHSMRHLELRSIERRLHGENQTPNRPRGPLAVLRSRLLLLRAIATLLVRRRRLRTAG
ncbi:glycosyl transferase family 2 [Xylanimonas cellulosilytica DSM 15894]|uniref:Glycosyl transferase family 2 n=1 Tax=Xylanimonas cellulosilytica (strain DSM 15894 / JCM 12276 / CECT 5975 / KCTC 9989 / LMG 20990 / NBRC 107835 / XIL07) TaxID=446471 RepID=D1BX13_XYLCX|nr:glycosyltransferase [Xylanimonas cellulosilytica]ACZ31581.1 glycosyl transferase family 2 [Xylanimonas cellulosilytica DSM 15894]